MKVLVLFLVAAVAVTDIDGSSLYPSTNDQHVCSIGNGRLATRQCVATAYLKVLSYIATGIADEVTEEYWKQPVGWILEQIGKWLQQSALLQSASYSAEDSAIRPEDFTIEYIRKVAEMLNKVADAVEKGEKADFFD